MKFKFFVITLTFILPVLGMAQPQGPLSKEARQRIEAQRIGFITQKLNLTPDEATKFWPVYNEYKDALRDMKDDMERPDLMNISDEEANTVIDRHIQQEQKRLDLQKKLITDLRKSISPRKIILLQASEREFNRGLLRKANEMNPQGGNMRDRKN
ncbi:MAG TPA: hypothetical protein VFG10_17325 [Saprospiraceae bacterium]|nr:hypothetical protein [Saprospiraceae bacterium]